MCIVQTVTWFDALPRTATHPLSISTSHSPGLAYSAYPGITCPAIINPDGVVSSSGIGAPRRTQPRWGILYLSTYSQGSRCAATLGYLIKPLRGKNIKRYV